MNPTQSNAQAGKVKNFKAGADLTDLEGLLVLLVAVSSLGVIKLPAAITDVPGFVLDEGGVSGAEVSVDPVTSEKQFRIRGKGVIAPGAAMVLAAIAGSDAGKLRQLPVAAGTYRVLFRCEEVAPTVDGQLVLCRWSPEGNIVVS